MIAPIPASEKMIIPEPKPKNEFQTRHIIKAVKNHSIKGDLKKTKQPMKKVLRPLIFKLLGTATILLLTFQSNRAQGKVLNLGEVLAYAAIIDEVENYPQILHDIRFAPGANTMFRKFEDAPYDFFLNDSLLVLGRFFSSTNFNFRMLVDLPSKKTYLLTYGPENENIKWKNLNKVLRRYKSHFDQFSDQELTLMVLDIIMPGHLSLSEVGINDTITRPRKFGNSSFYIGEKDSLPNSSKVYATYSENMPLHLRKHFIMTCKFNKRRTKFSIFSIYNEKEEHFPLRCVIIGYWIIIN